MEQHTLQKPYLDDDDVSSAEVAKDTNACFTVGSYHFQKFNSYYAAQDLGEEFACSTQFEVSIKSLNGKRYDARVTLQDIIGDGDFLGDLRRTV